MISRSKYLKLLSVATDRSPVTALLGPRQSGKTTLARQFAQGRDATLFDLESEQDLRILSNPELALGELQGLVVLDEIQLLPRLFQALRVLVDRDTVDTRFLILGSASPDLIRDASESLAGRIEFIDITGFDLKETGSENLYSLWRRGGFPRSFLASTETDSFSWRKNFIRTFLERDIPKIGIRIPTVAMQRFWTMLAHWHDQTWNASELGRSLGLTDKTVRGYLDILTGTFMVRQLQPWYANVSKRQVKSPKVYFRDTGLLHALLGIENERDLLGNPRVGASWEGFIIEQILCVLNQPQAWFWTVHSGGEIDLLVQHRGKWLGFEIKFTEAPSISKLMHKTTELLALDHLFVVCPARRAYRVSEAISVLPASDLLNLNLHIEALPRSQLRYSRQILQ